jgi:hypothetical protein
VEYRFLVPPTYTDFERAVIIAETCGQPVPMAAKEELIRKTSVEPLLHDVPEERPREKGKHVKGEERTSRKESLQDLREKERAREELINAPIVQQSGFQQPQWSQPSQFREPQSMQQAPLREPQSLPQSQQAPISEPVGEGWEQTKQEQPTARIDIKDRELPQVQILPPPEERKKAQEEMEVQRSAQRDVSV